MNKKLFALMMVPVVVVMGGTFAFSAWSGAANAFFGQSAATISYEESLSFEGTNAVHNPLTIGYDGHGSLTGVTSATSAQQLDNVHGGAASVINVYLNVSYLVPGQYADFRVVFTNHGSAVMNVSSFQYGSAQIYNGNGQSLGSPVSISQLQPPVGPSYLTKVTQDNLLGTNMLYLWNATSDSSTPGYLQPGQSLSYDMYAILPAGAGTNMQGINFYLEVSIPVSTVD